MQTRDQPIHNQGFQGGIFVSWWRFATNLAKRPTHCGAEFRKYKLVSG